jgi:hypothetical protein
MQEKRAGSIQKLGRALSRASLDRATEGKEDESYRGDPH